MNSFVVLANSNKVFEMYQIQIHKRIYQIIVFFYHFNFWQRETKTSRRMCWILIYISFYLSYTISIAIWQGRVHISVRIHSIAGPQLFRTVNNKLNIFMKFLSCYISMIISAVPIVLISPLVSNEKRLPLNAAFPLE